MATKKTTAGAKKKKSTATSKKDTGPNVEKWGETTHEQGWTYVPNILLEHQAELGITPAELNVILMVMKYWWERDNLPWPSVKRVADAMGRSRSVVQRHIRALENRGYVKRLYRKDSKNKKANLSNQYDFNGLVKAVNKIARKRQKEKTLAAKAGKGK